jgi:hypothetical protein
MGSQKNVNERSNIGRLKKVEQLRKTTRDLARRQTTQNELLYCCKNFT